MAAAAAQQPTQQPLRGQQQHPFRVRTITVFLQLPADSSHWEAEVAAAGRFLAHAQQHLESLGYEVQTVRIATQPFPAFLPGTSSSSSNSRSSGSSGSSTDAQQQQQQDQDHQEQEHQQQHSSSLDNDLMVTNAVLLESLAAKQGIPLVSLGSSSDPQHLAVIPRLITATKGTSCTFALPAEADLGLAYQVAEVVMRIAGQTDGMGNFRFGSASNMQPGIPYFPVACCGPDQHRTFAIGTEADGLLYQAFGAAAAAADPAAAAVDGGQRCPQPPNILQLAEQQLHAVLLQHFAPLQEAALQIQASYQQSSSSSSGDSDSDSTACFRYLGFDTSLAPGLDTPPLTGSYQSLLQHMMPAHGAGAGAGAGTGAAAAAGSTADNEAQTTAPAPAVAAAFGGPGSLTVSSLITSVLKKLPLRLTGYCGLMLAVCEDQGLAAAAAAGSITISQLLQYSAVCGCGLDTVPVPGPTATQQQQQPLEQAGVGQPVVCSVTAAAQDAATTAAIAGLVADVNTLAYRLNKPLACRLLPLPDKLPGQPTDFHHPYMINSRVMDLCK